MALLLPARARIESFKEREAVCKHIVVIWICGEKPAESQVDPSRLVTRELAVAKVRLVHDLGEMREPAVPKAGPLDECLEGAVVSHVAELGLRGVEGNRVRRELVGASEEERRLRIDESLDQPGRRNTVDMGAGTCDPPLSPEGPEVKCGLVRACRLFGRALTHVNCLPQSLDFGASRRVEEVELPKLLEVLCELGQVPVDPRTRRGGLPLEGLDHLPVARRKLPVLRVAGLMEQANDVGAAHVLDLVDTEQDRLAAFALDLLAKPLELLVIVRRVREQVDRSLQRDGAQRPEPAPHAHAQTGRVRRQTYYEQEELGIHCCPHVTTVAFACQALFFELSCCPICRTA